MLNESVECSSPGEKGKVLGVIVLTDNRTASPTAKPQLHDYRNSSFKGRNDHMQRQRSIHWIYRSLLPTTPTTHDYY